MWRSGKEVMGKGRRWISIGRGCDLGGKRWRGGERCGKVYIEGRRVECVDEVL